MNFADTMTAVILSSPMFCHPSTHVLEETYTQLRKHLPDIPVLILLDGVHPEQNRFQQRYEEYKSALRGKNWSNVTFFEFSDWQHQTGMLNQAIVKQGLVRTPLVLVLEQDRPLCDGPNDWDGIIGAVASNEFASIRFECTEDGFKQVIGPAVSKTGVPLIETEQFVGVQCPQVASLSYLTEFIQGWGEQTKSFVELAVPDVDWIHRRDSFRCAIYAPPGRIIRMYNLDGAYRGMSTSESHVGHPYIITRNANRTEYVQWYCGRVKYQPETSK